MAGIFPGFYICRNNSPIARLPPYFATDCMVMSLLRLPHVMVHTHCMVAAYRNFMCLTGICIKYLKNGTRNIFSAAPLRVAAGRVGIPYDNDFIPNTRDAIDSPIRKRKRMLGYRIIGKVRV